MKPPAWGALERALVERRTLRALYHGHKRLICPHAIGWDINGRAVVFVYQAGGTTSSGPLPEHPGQRWRSMFVDEVEVIATAGDRWQTAENYSPGSVRMNRVEVILK
jgi:hypothetical protein